MDFRQLKIGDLELFLTAARAGSVREAARESRIEVAHVSRVLKRIEEGAGRKLFERSPRGLVLSADGVEFRAAVEKGLEQIREATSEADARTSDEGEVLDVVGAPTFLMGGLVLPCLAKLRARRIIASAQIVELLTDRLVLSGLRGMLRLAFHAGKLEWPRTWQSESLGKIRWRLVASRRFFPESEMRERTVLEKDFVYPVTWTPEGVRDFEDRCPLLLRYRKRAVGVSSGWMALDLVRSVPALTYVPDILLGAPGLEDLHEIRVDSWPLVDLPVYLSAQSDRIRRRLFREIVEASSEELGRYGAAAYK